MQLWSDGKDVYNTRTLNEQSMHCGVLHNAQESMNTVIKIAFLLLLYFVQGLPFGFQAKALPIYLREDGTALRYIGFLHILSFPWLLKSLWAPLVDRYYSTSVGRRRSWLLPCQFGLFIISLLSMMHAKVDMWLLISVFLSNLFAATQDIAVDGLALDLLHEDPEVVHLANTAQVVGYKIGMLIGGGWLSWLTADLGLEWYFGIAATLQLVALGTVALYKEDSGSTEFLRAPGDLRPPKAMRMGEVDEASVEERRRAREASTASVWTRLRSALAYVVQSIRSTLSYVPVPALLLICTYKSGESMSDSMFKAWVVDSGHGAQWYGFWSGMVGMMMSIIGSIVGGFMSKHFSTRRALIASSVFRVFPQVGRFLLAAMWNYNEAGDAQEHFLIANVIVEAVAGGVVTTIVFTYMMQVVENVGRSDLRATHFTVLASVEVLGKTLTAMSSGIITEHFGYGTVFGISAVLTALVVPIAIQQKAKVASKMV